MSYSNVIVNLAAFISTLVLIKSGQATDPTTTTSLATVTGPVITGVPTPQLFIPRLLVSHPPTAPFPSVGSISQDFSPQGLDNLWSIVSQTLTL